jgi:hypothetical protein
VKRKVRERDFGKRFADRIIQGQQSILVTRDILQLIGTPSFVPGPILLLTIAITIQSNLAPTAQLGRWFEARPTTKRTYLSEMALLIVVETKGERQRISAHRRVEFSPTQETNGDTATIGVLKLALARVEEKRTKLLEQRPTVIELWT